MAISVDRVYQKVLAIANKEQRGYITPQEFNLFADHAQMEIFEQYFYDLEQRQRGVGNELDYGDIISNIEEKISIFERFNMSVGTGFEGEIDISSGISEIYRLGTVRVRYWTQNGYKVADKIQLNELDKYENSPLAAPSKSKPIYTKFSTPSVPLKIKIYPYPASGDSVTVNYIARPESPDWTYVISGQNALHNPTNVKDFQLHESEENNLVIKILQSAGVAIKDVNLAQMAGQKEVSTIQQQKQ